MKITRVEAFAIRLDHHYKVAGRAHGPDALPGTPYYFEPAWRQVYSTQLMTCLVKITTDAGVVGWGEAQAPIAPEVIVSIIRELIGPALLGQDALAHSEVFERLTHMMDVRGHRDGYLGDAIAAVDIALWDIKGRHAGVPLATLLSGDADRPLALYVSGLRKPTREEQAELAAQYVADGYAGVKMFLTGSPTSVAEHVRHIREALGEPGRLMVDLLWGYSLAEALELVPTLEAAGVDFLEAPLPINALDDHAQLASATRVPIAIGEHIHTAAEFRTWVERGRPRVLQPDVARTGITEALRIATLADSYGCDIAWHIGTCGPLAMATTWHLAARTSSPYLQEHQAELLPVVNTLAEVPLPVVSGAGRIPQRPGVGVEIDETAVRARSTDSCDVGSPSPY